MSSGIKSKAMALLAAGLWLWSAMAVGAPVPAAPAVGGTAHVLLDFNSGRILAEADKDKRVDPASLTKIMTAHVVFRALREGSINMDEEVLVSEKAWRTGGSKTFIEVGKRIKVSDLVHGMIIQSGNDACVALAERIAGSEDAFADLMNKEAQRLGMKDTHFVNATGLPDPNHYSTASDMLKVAMATIREFPEYYPIYAQKDFMFNGIKQINRNRLLWRDSRVDGMKTGHTEAAGYCLVASAVEDGMRLMSVIMGTKSEEARAVDTLALLTYGFQFYLTHKLYDAEQPLKVIRVWKGDSKELALGMAEPFYVTIPKGRYKELSAQVEISGQALAPINKGQALGKVVVRLGDEVVEERPLVALADVAEGGFFHNLADTVLLWFE